jgi:hypothetical protein
VLQDLGSTNGTFVNGQRVTTTQVLNPGDIVSFGETIVLRYESAMDPNATILSARAPRTAVPVQRPTPVPAPAPVYSGQVPAGPVPMAAAPEKKKFPVWLIIVIIILVVICACVGFFVIIDQLKLWCQVVPFLVPMLGGTC